MAKTKPVEAATAEAWFCDGEEAHLHIELKNERGDEISSIVLDFDDGLDLVQSLMAKIEEMTGLTFVLIEDEDDDEIGPVMGHC